VKRVILCTPPVHEKGDASRAGHDESLARYAEWLLARRADGWDVVDLHGPMRRALDERRARDPGFAFADDGVHPGREGHWLMARELARALLGADPGASAGSSEALFAARGAEIRALVHERMRSNHAAFMTAIGHSRPGVAGGPGA
jgi:hypothetical protein